MRLPLWQPPDWRAIRLIILLIGTLLWLTLYSWLFLHLWRIGVAPFFAGQDTTSFALILASVGLGVPLMLAWRAQGAAWLARVRTGMLESQWAALSPTQAHKLTPREFEEYVAQRIFARQGYTVQNTPDVKDGGIDILVRDQHGHLIIVQCKRYSNTVGSGTVRELYGTMIHAGAAHAFLVTSGRISQDAQTWARDKPIFLVDGILLARLARARPGTLQRLFTR